jgi:hypothetical protein
VPACDRTALGDRGGTGKQAGAADYLRAISRLE